MADMASPELRREHPDTSMSAVLSTAYQTAVEAHQTLVRALTEPCDPAEILAAATQLIRTARLTQFTAATTAAQSGLPWSEVGAIMGLSEIDARRIYGGDEVTDLRHPHDRIAEWVHRATPDDDGGPDPQV